MHMSAVGFKVPYALNNGLRSNDSEWTGRANGANGGQWGANGGQWGPMGANGGQWVRLRGSGSVTDDLFGL